MFRFIIVAVGLVAALFLGYMRFIGPSIAKQQEPQPQTDRGTETSRAA
jgi:hypothetical protein